MSCTMSSPSSAIQNQMARHRAHQLAGTKGGFERVPRCERRLGMRIEPLELLHNLLLEVIAQYPEIVPGSHSSSVSSLGPNP